MSENLHGEDDTFLKDLGMTKERMYELIRIVNNTMLKEGQCGMTSHVLLNIAGRKDLNDLEKTICSFIFSTTAFKNSNISGNINKQDVENVEDVEGIEDVGKSSQSIMMEDVLGFPEGLFISPQDMSGSMSGSLPSSLQIDKKELMEILMTSIVFLAKQLPRDEAVKFFRKSSIRLAKISVTL